MRHLINFKNEEQGSAMVVALVMLVLLTLIGIMATRTSEIEILTARNEKLYINEFFVADSAWREGVEWLNTLVAPPDVVNIGIFNSGVTLPGALNIKNYGDLGSDSYIFDGDDPPGEDGTLNTGGRGVDVDYWYEVAYSDAGDSMSGVTVPGSGPGYRKFYFTTKSIADKDQQRSVQVTAGKIFQVGY